MLILRKDMNIFLGVVADFLLIIIFFSKIER
jgi:hypothetical protein